MEEEQTSEKVHWSRIDKFFLSFSYSTKFRFTLILTLIIASTVIYQNINLRTKFYANANYRESGANYQRSLSQLLINYIKLKMRDSVQEKRQTQQFTAFRINDNLEELQNIRNGSFIGQLFLTRWQSPKLEKGVNWLQREWNSIRAGGLSKGEKRDILNTLITETKALIDTVNIESKLLLDDDSGTLHLTKLTTELIPSLTVLLNELFDVNSEFSSEDPVYTTKLKFLSRKLFSLITRAGQHYDLYTERNPTLATSEGNLALLEHIKRWQGGLATLATTMEEGSILDKGYLNLNQNIGSLINDSLSSTLDTQELLFNQLIKLLTIQRKSESTIYYLGFILPLIPLLIIFYLHTIRQMSHPLSELKKGTEKMLQGDFSYRIRVTTHDEVANMCQLFNQLANKLESAFQITDDIAVILTEKSHEATSQTDRLQEKIKGQATSIMKVSNHANEVAQTVTHISTSLGQVRELVKATTLQANEGEMSLLKMEKTIIEMQASASHVVDTLSNFQKKVGKTSDVINMIVKIVDQANLLSINSAINASRTGEKGVGFVIIAEQVRELANQSAYFTLDIEQKVIEIVPTLEDVSGLVTQFSTEIEKQSSSMKLIKSQIHDFINLTKKQVGTFNHVNEGMLNQTKRANKIDALSKTQNELANYIINSAKYLQTEVGSLHEAASSFHDVLKKYKGK